MDADICKAVVRPDVERDIMLNLALLADPSDFNEFTTVLRDRSLVETAVLVRMRNNEWIEVIFSPATLSAGRDDDNFRTADWSRVWHANGESISSNCFDLIEMR